MGVRCIGFGCGVVGLGLLQLLRSGAVLRGVEHGALHLRVGLGLGYIFGAIAALEALVVCLGLFELGLRLCALRLYIIELELHQQSASLDCLALLDEDLGDAAADL